MTAEDQDPDDSGRRFPLGRCRELTLASSTYDGNGGGAPDFTRGELRFKAQPDFEKPGDANTDNVYEVTVVAADANGNRGTMDVKVTVENEE